MRDYSRPRADLVSKEDIDPPRLPPRYLSMFSVGFRTISRQRHAVSSSDDPSLSADLST